MKLSDTQRVILSQASQHDWRLAPLPKLPKAAANAVLKSLLAHGLLAECTAPAEHRGRGWRQDEDGAWIALRITDAGLRAIGVEPEGAPTVGDRAPTGASGAAAQDDPAAAAAAAEGAPVVADEGEDSADDRPRHERHGVSDDLIYGPPDEDNGGQQPPAERAEDLALLDQALAAPRSPPRRSLRDAAAAVLAAWDDEANRATDVIGALEGPMQALRTALAGKPARAPREPSAPRKPREGTKQETVLAMLRRPEGATVAQITEATGWAPHTVRGFFAGLKKRQGIAVEAAERVRQVGPNKEGARGSYTIYHIAG